MRMKWSAAAREQAIALARQGLKDKEIAQQLGVTQQTFSGWRMRKPLFRAEMDAAKLPTKAARRLLNAQGISPNSERGKQLIEMAWQVHRAQPPTPPTEPPTEPAQLKQQAKPTKKAIYGGPISPEDMALLDSDFPPIDWAELDLIMEGFAA